MNQLKEALTHLQCELVAERQLINPQEISWMQYDILVLLEKNNYNTPSELSQRLGISRSKFSKAIKQLKDHQYVTQQINQHDGRGLITSLTETGQTLLDQTTQQHHRLHQISQLLFSKEEQAIFIQLSNKLSQALADERMKQHESIDSD